jgi:hypothetical protein
MLFAVTGEYLVSPGQCFVTETLQSRTIDRQSIDWLTGEKVLTVDYSYSSCDFWTGKTVGRLQDKTCDLV